MISAFGVEHEIAKARRGPGVVHGRVDPNTSMVQRGGSGEYFNPSKEQVAASKARRAEQAAYKAGKLDRRVGGGKKVPWSAHYRAMGKVPKVVAPIALVGAGAGYALHERTKEPFGKMSREQKDTATNTALGATAGTAAGVVGVTGGGQAAKITLKNRRAKRGQSPREQQIWAKHTQKYPSRKVAGNNWKTYANYPKELPDWRGQRLLAFKNRPAVTGALVGATALAGAKIGHDRSKNKR